MKRLLLALLVAAIPAFGATPLAGCGALCGSWVLDTTRSDAVEPLLTAALNVYKDPRQRRAKVRSQTDTVAAIEADMENSIGPILNRPRRDDIRTELLQLLTSPRTMTLATQNASIVITAAQRPTRKVTIGTPHARVDAVGTARIRGKWQGKALTISEDYDRKRSNSETYALQDDDNTLQVTLVVQRPGLTPLRIRSVYRRN